MNAKTLKTIGLAILAIATILLAGMLETGRIEQLGM